MSIVKPPITEPRNADQPADEVDRLLFAYFRKEMPQPWPELKLPADTFLANIEPSVTRRPLIRSRWALAASIALLLLGHWLLAGKFQSERPSSPGKGLNIGMKENLNSRSTQPDRR